MSESNIQVRKIPKKHIVAIVMVIIVGFGFYYVNTQLREAKMVEVLGQLGHNDISNITVFKVHKVEDPEVRRKGTLYSLKFTNAKQQECRGFVLRNYKKEYSQDLECK
jgi:hypothetical protein